MKIKSCKRTILLFVPMVFVMAILVVALADISVQSGWYKEEIKELNSKVASLQEQVAGSQEVLGKIEILKYQDEVLKKKYPVFAKVVKTVYSKSKEYHFDPNLIMGLIQVESNFKPFAVSSQGAYGLMQVNYSVWKDELDINYKQIFDIEYNIDLGLRILKRYYTLSRGNILKALHLYNNGFLYNNEGYKYKVINTVFY